MRAAPNSQRTDRDDHLASEKDPSEQCEYKTGEQQQT